MEYPSPLEMPIIDNRRYRVNILITRQYNYMELRITIFIMIVLSSALFLTRILPVFVALMCSSIIIFVTSFLLSIGSSEIVILSQ